jgi:tripartite-type tricarboxylate transporter receptor subunit TctC
VTLGLILLSVERNLAAGAKYPTKPIQVILGFAPGGTDVILRPFIDRMPDYLGQPMTFVYKTGATGTLGAGFVASSKPDGYNILGGTSAMLVVTPQVQKVPYSLESFTPICNLAESYSTLWVQSSARWKNLSELVADAKENPGKISFVSPGTLSVQRLLVEAFAKEAGIKLNHIPAQGGASGFTPLLGGHVDMSVGDVASGSPHFKTGAIRPLGVFNTKRIRSLPNSPTFVEQGYAVDMPMSYGLSGPKDIPRDIVEALSSAARKVYENHKPSLLDSYDKSGSEINYLPPEEFSAALLKERNFFSKIVKDLDMTK